MATNTPGQQRPILTVDGFLTQCFVYDGSGNVQYIGRAEPGSAKTAAVWQIQKLTYGASGVTDIQWANGSPAYNNVFNNYAGFTYS